jgi:hypothetical protein
MKTQEHWTLPAWLVACLGLLPLPAQAQYIKIPVSVKFILSPTGVRPTGLWTNADHWRQAIDIANAGNARFGRGIRYLYPTFDGDVSGYGQYYDLEGGETVQFDYAMQTDGAAQTHWRSDALNVYVVHTTLGGNGSGWAGNPQDPLPDPYTPIRPRVVVFAVNMQGDNQFTLMAHEFGHHQGLIHTWWIDERGDDDRVADTPVDVDPNQCPSSYCACMFLLSQNRALLEGWSLDTLRMMTNNLMSYHCDNLTDFDLSEGQLDRWADMTRMYLASEDTGLTYFAESGSHFTAADGYSQSYFTTELGFQKGGPFPTVDAAVAAANPEGGDIVMLRPGNFNEQITINKPVTLRATRAGWVTIGRPW